MDDAGYDSDGDLVLSLVPGLAEGLSAAAAEAEACVFLSFFFFCNSTPTTTTTGTLWEQSLDSRSLSRASPRVFLRSFLFLLLR